MKGVNNKMIIINNIDRFLSVIDDLKASGVSVNLYGRYKEAEPNFCSGSGTPSNNKLEVHIVALTSAGTIFHNGIIKLDEKDTVENYKLLLDKLDIKDADVSYSATNGTVTIK